MNILRRFKYFKRFKRLMREIEIILDEIEFIEVDAGVLNDHQIDVRREEISRLHRKARKINGYAIKLYGDIHS